MADNSNPVVIFFIDALGEKAVENMNYVSSIRKGTLDVSEPPPVTPKVISEITTGEKPTETGILCPTRLNKENLVRPLCKTMFEELSEDRRVLNYRFPFTMNQQGRFLTSIGTAPQVAENEPPLFQMPRPGGRMWDSENPNGKLDEEDRERVLQGHVDYVRNVNSVMRNICRQGVMDVFFIALRLLDSWTHFWNESCRNRLAKYIDREIYEWSLMGDMEGNIFVFGDHGGRRKKETFFINKFLEEKNYLDVDVHERKLKKQREQDNQADENLTQVSVHSPFVELSKDSQVVSNDSFDAGVTVLDDSIDIEDLKEDLMGTGFFDNVYTPEELYGEGRYSSDTLGLTLVCDRSEGILVTGNLHPELDGVTASEVSCLCQGKIRLGVHERRGVIATNDPVLSDCITLEPTELHDIIRKFVRRNAPSPSTEDLYGTAEMPGREEEIRGRLEDLGYI